MKKSYMILILIFGLLMSACKNNDKYGNYISMANCDLKENYSLNYIIQADCCYGVHNEALVFYKLGYPNFTDSYFANPIGYNHIKYLLDCSFSYNKIFSFMAWKNGKFYTLNQEGIFQNIESNDYIITDDLKLTKEFISEMAEIHIRFFYTMDDIMKNIKKYR